jgi:protein TonB
MRALYKTVGCLFLLAAVAAAQDAVRQVTQAEALALVVTRVEPEFPAMARQLKIAGAVEIEVVIGENGAVESVKPVNGNPVLTRSASDALKRWKFKPFQHDGAAVKVQTTLKISFSK